MLLVTPVSAANDELVIKMGSLDYKSAEEALKEGNEIYLPVRSVMNAIDVKIVWDEKNGKIILSEGTARYQIEVNQKESYAIGKDQKEKIKIKVVDGVTYLPLSYLEEIITYPLKWDDNEPTLIVDTIKAERTEEGATKTALTNLPKYTPTPAPSRSEGAKKTASSEGKVVYRQTGTASWYGDAHHGRKTANGERFNMHELTAAHPKLAFGTKVKVTSLSNGKSVVVRINDRGPYSGGRIIDLSKAAARELNMISSGVAKVKLEVIK